MKEGQGNGSKRGKSGWNITEGKERRKKKGDERFNLGREILGKKQQHSRL